MSRSASLSSIAASRKQRVDAATERCANRPISFTFFFWDPVFGVEPLYLPSDSRREPRRIEKGDRPDARLGAQHTLPCLLRANCVGCDEADAGDDDPLHSLLHVTELTCVERLAKAIALPQRFRPPEPCGP